MSSFTLTYEGGVVQGINQVIKIPVPRGVFICLAEANQFCLHEKPCMLRERTGVA